MVREGGTWRMTQRLLCGSYKPPLITIEIRCGSKWPHRAPQRPLWWSKWPPMRIENDNPLVSITPGELDNDNPWVTLTLTGQGLQLITHTHTDTHTHTHTLGQFDPRTTGGIKALIKKSVQNGLPMPSLYVRHIGLTFMKQDRINLYWTNIRLSKIVFRWMLRISNVYRHLQMCIQNLSVYWDL